MASLPKPVTTPKPAKPLPAPNSNFCELVEPLPVEELAAGKQVRTFIGSFQLVQASPSDARAALAKAFTTAKCGETVTWARELFGGNGIAVEYNVGRSFADAEALHSY